MQIKVKIGAALDGDLEKILFEPMVRGAKRARGVAKAEVMSARDEQLAILKGKIAKENALVRQQKAHELAMARDAARQEVREKTKAVQDIRRAEKQAAQERERENRQILAQAERDARDKARIMATAERMAAKAQQEREKKVRSFASSATGTAAGIVRHGVGVAADIARGAGVSFDVGSSVRRRIDMERSAVDLSNSAYQEQGVGVQTLRADPKDLIAQANAVAQANAIDPSKALEGLQGFVGITGDLETGRTVLGDLAKLARATGTDLDQMVKAAGEMAKGMGDAATNTEEARGKASAVYAVMKGLAGQGKLGSVEMKDMATHGARLAAAAGQFEGNAGESIMKMGMFAQEARGGGGAWNAATAAGAVSGLVTNFKTAATRKAFKNAGVSLNGAGGKLRDPTEILKDAIDKTGGNIDKLTPLFKNVVGARAMQGLANKYLEASGGRQDKESKAKGRAAVQDEIDRMTKKATMSDAEVNESFSRAMDTTGTKVELFQQKLDRLVGDMADQVMPAMMKLAPTALDAVSGLGKIATWAASNPMQAVGATIAAGLGKAMGDQLATAAATRMASAFAGNMALTGVTLATLAIASVGMMAIEHLAKKSEEDDKRKFKTEAEELNKRVALRAAKEQADKEAKAGGVTSETAARLAQAKFAVGDRERDLKQQLSEAEGKKKAGFLDDLADGFNGKAAGRAFNSLMSMMLISTRVGDEQTVAGYSKEQKTIGDTDAIKAELAELKAAMNNVNTALGGTLKVAVDGGAPLMSGGGTTGSGG